MRRIHKRKFRGKLKYKYLAAFIGVSLFLALILTFSYYWYFNRMYEQQTQEYIRNMGRESIGSLELTMKQINTVILSIQSEDTIQDFLYGVDHHQYTIAEQVAMQNSLRNTVYANILWTDSITNVYLESDRGHSEIWEKSGGGVIWNRDRRQFIYDGGGRAVWLGLDDSGRFMQVGAQINSKKDMSVLGFLMLQIPADDFSSHVENMSFIREGKSLIVDSTMNVIISTGDEVSQVSGELKDLISDDMTGNDLLRTNVAGIDSYVYIEKMNSADWYMVSLIPRISYLGVLRDLRVVLGVFCVLVLFGISLLIFYIVSRFTERIENLQEAMQRFGEGDFNVICAVRANDEIGELSQHFNMMVYNINDLVDRVYNANMLRQKAELEALRMQINPHFLYNTLDMVAWISRDKGVTEVADIAVSLSQMMRYTIKGTAMTDLKAELEHIRHYLTIQLFGISLLIFYIVSRFTERIENLQEAMQRFGEGDFNVICAVRANDEIGELSQHFNMMVYNINDLVDRVYNANMLRQKAELEALRMQINPHFLYNTLDMVAWISRDKGVTEVADIAVSLSQMMRYTIKGTAMTDLKAELEHIRHYLTIQKLRYGDRITFIVQSPEELMGFRLPKLVIQPLVENAIIHGVENIEQGVVVLDVQKVKDRVRICVSDNGVGMEQSKIDEILGEDEELIMEAQDSIGLRNVNRRLKIRYGESHGLVIESVPGSGTRICIWIPMTENAEDNS